MALATAGVTPALEIIDSRVKDWKIKIQDTVADNASAAAFVIGATLVPLGAMDLRHVGLVLTKNGKLAGAGAGAAVLGSPLQSVAWLINKMSEMGVGVKAGEIILSGAASAAVDVARRRFHPPGGGPFGRGSPAVSPRPSGPDKFSDLKGLIQTARTLRPS